MAIFNLAELCLGIATAYSAFIYLAHLFALSLVTLE
jgi:hypothetical protein